MGEDQSMAQKQLGGQPRNTKQIHHAANFHPVISSVIPHMQIACEPNSKLVTNTLCRAAWDK